MSTGLRRLYDFFESSGSERYQGLDESYFSDLNDFEKQEAWGFLIKKCTLSEDVIKGLYILDKKKAVDIFKNALSQPIEEYQYRAQRMEAERNRVLMLKYVLEQSPEKQYFLEIIKFSNSDFEEVRADFAESVPFLKIVPEVVDALKGMIVVETDRAPLSSAITKLMVIHGLDFDASNDLYKSIYLALRSGSVSDKFLAMRRLARMHKPEYIS